MKKLKILSLLLVSFVFANCDMSDGQKAYEGENVVFFNTSEPTDRIVLSGSGDDVIASIPFGTVAAASESYQVSLVFDAENSTAEPGVDFEIVSDVVTVEPGVTTGSFDVKYFQTPAVAEGKVAVFKLVSSSIESAIFKNAYTVTIALSCQVDLVNFPLTYDVEVFAFNEAAPSHTQTLSVVSGQENTFSVTSMWGPNFVAWATGNASYEGQFVYPARLVLNCDGTVDVVTTGTQFLGGSGTWDAETGIIDVTIQQGVFTSPFDTQVIFYPSQS